jgi:predicted anti-sigma-YlaC factor YlaD
MNEQTHARAEKLIAQQRVEGISAAEQQWLVAHLRECPRCAQFAQQTNDAVRVLRSAAIAMQVPRGLAERTRFRLQLRAQELREREPKSRLLWILCAVSWALGLASAPYVWQGLQWIGDHTGAPRLLLEFGFGLWWAIPALFAAAVVVIENLRQANERHLPGGE